MKTLPASSVNALRRPFTLVELLVVIAMIGILASLLLPALSAAQERAKSSSCQANEKQIALAIGMYVDDYEGKFPPDSYGPGMTYTTPNGGAVNNWYMVWMFMVWPYIGNADVFNCPSVKTPRFVGQYTGDVRYGYNSNGVANRLITRIPAIDSVILLAETQPPNNSYRIYYARSSHSFDTLNGGSLAPRHGNGFNCAYADGHVKWVLDGAVRTDNVAWTGTP